MAIDVRLAESAKDAIVVATAYKQMHDEGCFPGAFSPVKVLTNVIRLIRGPGSCVLMAEEDGRLAGVLSLYEDGYWWSEDDTNLIDKGLFIAPEYRGGEALRLLMAEAARTSDDLGIPCYLTVFNEKREAKRRRGSFGWQRIGSTLGYTNRGAVIAHFPEA